MRRAASGGRFDPGHGKALDFDYGLTRDAQIEVYPPETDTRTSRTNIAKSLQLSGL